MSRLGETIRASRIRANMTEKALAKKCGLSEGVIKDMESGRRIPTDEQAKRILKLLGVADSLSTELDAAQAPDDAPRPRPRPKPYVLPATEPEPEPVAPDAGMSTDAWRDALGGVVKRVPVTGEDSMVIEHILTPIVAGRIEGGAPDKVFYYRCPDNDLSGYRVFAGDLLLTVPAATVDIQDSMMVLQYKGRRIARKVMRLDGGKLLLQSYDREFRSETIDRKDALVIGRCVKLVRTL